MEHDLFWHGLKVGDLATWVAGIATLLAVCAAIGVPWIQAWRERDERRRHEDRSAQILAIELIELFLRLRRDMISRRQIFPEASNGFFNANPGGLTLQLQLSGADELPHGADLQNLPYPIAPAIAALRSNLAMYNGAVGLLIGYASTMTMADATTKLRLPEMLDSTQAALARAAHHLRRYEQGYGLINYFDRGDGTELKALPDYGGE